MQKTYQTFTDHVVVPIKYVFAILAPSTPTLGSFYLFIFIINMQIKLAHFLISLHE